MTAPSSGNLAPPGYYQVIAVDSSGVPSRGFIVSFPQTAADVAVYALDQTSGTAVPDSSGNGRNGTLGGTPLPTWVAGHSGNGVRIPGGAGGTAAWFVDLPDGIVSSCTDVTFAAWVNTAQEIAALAQ